MTQSSSWKPFISTALVYVLKRTEIQLRVKKAPAVLNSEAPFVSVGLIPWLFMLLSSDSMF